MELFSRMQKAADATSIPFADSATDTAAAAPLPGLAVGNKPAPGQTGPKGLSPRTNYSRVNTGSPLQADAGASSQKGMPPDNQNFLPPKIAHREVPMSGTMTQRYTIHEMVKAAAEGTLDQAAVTLEAERQLANRGESTAAATKTASAVPTLVQNSIPTDYVEKLAGACEYMLDELREKAAAEAASANGPGKGPNALQVLEATSENNAFKDGHQGQATPAHVVPKTPGTHKPAESPAGPATALDTNAAEAVGGTQKVSTVTVAELRKAASKENPEGHKLRRALLGNPISAAIEAKPGEKLRAAGEATGHYYKETVKGLGKGLAAGGIAGGLAGGIHGAATGKGLKGSLLSAGKGALAGGSVGGAIGSHVGAAKGHLGSEASRIHGAHSKHKEASAIDPRLVDYFLSMTKAAEDAINPAQISAGAAVAPETSASGESGGAPAGGLPEGPTDLVGSNEAAINYTRGQAKAPMKSQLSAVLTEPALSSAHDTTLGKAFDHTGAAGVKISSMRSAAARAVVEKLAEAAACKTDPKKKVSAGMGNFQAPPVSGAATGAM